GVVAVGVGGVAAGVAEGLVGMRAEPAPADVLRALVAVAGAGSAVGLGVREARAGPVAGVGVVAVGVGGVAAGVAEGLVGMRAESCAADVLCALVAVARAGGPVGLGVGEAAPGSVAGV